MSVSWDPDPERTPPSGSHITSNPTFSSFFDPDFSMNHGPIGTVTRKRQYGEWNRFGPRQYLDILPWALELLEPGHSGRASTTDKASRLMPLHPPVRQPSRDEGTVEDGTAPFPLASWLGRQIVDNALTRRPNIRKSQ
ncbi:uncharacterized protein G6M90_00g010100 [Metarhizium brunneum]|uniref:Uncharacterized protein n=1 Tax=Metarhizium brunneum TaxID=500148 RepID=A0A7D5UQD8_9HYPO